MTEARVIKIGHEREFLSLSDVHDGWTTRSSKGALESIHAYVALPNLRAEAHVSLSNVHDPPLETFFDDLATHWRGWDDVKEWRAYAHGLALSCTHDGLGHITMTVELRQLSGAGWLVRGDVPLDAGQLERLAREVDQFVSHTE